MAQGVLPYKYEQENQTSGMTSLAGLPIYLDLASVLNLGESIARHLHIKMQGWTDEQIVMSLILLNLAGGDSVDDLRLLAADEGFAGYFVISSLRDLKEKSDGKQKNGGARRSTGRSLPPLPYSGISPPSTPITRVSKGRQ